MASRTIAHHRPLTVLQVSLTVAGSGGSCITSIAVACLHCSWTWGLSRCLCEQEYAIRKQELIDVERHLLRTFGFVLHVDHPHKFVLNYLNIFLKADQTLKQEAWSLANDRCNPVAVAVRSLTSSKPTGM